MIPRELRPGRAEPVQSDPGRKLCRLVVNGVQFMVKDSKKYASTGGWKFAQFDEGKPLEDEAKLKSCFDCHAAVKDRDLVFTRYAPVMPGRTTSHVNVTHQLRNR